MTKIEKVAKSLNLPLKDLFVYPNNIAKVSNKNYDKKGKLILVTAMTSNKAGIGKTTVSIGLADALKHLNKKVCLSLREPSMGPVFGIKGGATGGGKSVVEPSDEINLNFTGDFHAISMASNLLRAVVDNHIYQGNQLNIDVNNIFAERCIDVNDRSLREISYTIKDQSVKSSFVITAASEIMAVMSLSKNFDDLKTNLANIIVALDNNSNPVFAKDLNCVDSLCVILKDAFNANLVQTKYGTPALIHLGPFANIAHGCSSVVATNTALSLADYCITEAGFGSDLGAEKFLDIKTRILNKVPNAVVLVVTLNVVKQHGLGNIEKGFENVKKHIENLKQFNLPFVVAINHYKDDKTNEINLLKKLIENEGCTAVVCKAFSEGYKGCTKLANIVLDLCDLKNNINYCYNIEDSIETKLNKIATNIYGAKSVVYSKKAQQKLELIKKLKLQNLFVNVAKTQFSFADNKDLIGRPTNFDLHVLDFKIRNGAKMIVAICGKIMLMPGLAKDSNYANIKIDKNKKISGIF